jgi:hypothetical protein
VKFVYTAGSRTNEHPAVAQCHARWGSHHFAQEPLINPFYTFFIEASQHLLNHWIAGSRQVLALVGAGGKRRPTPAVIDPVPGGRILLSERQGRLLEALVRRSSAPQRLVKRAQIILLLAAGKRFNVFKFLVFDNCSSRFLS